MFRLVIAGIFVRDGKVLIMKHTVAGGLWDMLSMTCILTLGSLRLLLG